jgi:gas vesicle protein
MTERDFSKELYFSHSYDMENGNDMDTICYHSLINIITELVDRIEKLEQRLDRNDKWKSGLAKVAKEVNTNVQESVSNVQESVSNVLEINKELQGDLSKIISNC